MTRTPSATALLVVDMQSAFADGPHASPQMPTVLPAVQSQVRAARSAGALVVFLQNDGPSGAVDEPDTEGWRLAIRPGPRDEVIRKRQDSGFEETCLGELLERHGVQVVSVCGVMSEMCVAATIRDAQARGLTVLLAHDSHGTYPVPAFAEGDIEVSAEQAARAAEWSLGNAIHIPASWQHITFEAVPQSMSPEVL